VSELDGWISCPRCRADLNRDVRAVRCPECGLVVYAKPAPAICGLVVDDAERVLLGRRAHEPAAGKWDILGGFMDEFEQPLDTLRRELREETGLEVEPVRFVGAVSDRYGEDGNATLNLCWTARVVSGEAMPADDVAELRWFAAGELPPTAELAFPNTSSLLALWRDLRGSSTTS
jgi:ADP-ribose pyrophosphatase YjhB (NUDIX family)